MPLMLDRESLASILPDGEHAFVQLASLPASQSEFQVARVAGKQVRSFEQLHAAVERASDSCDNVEVVVAATRVHAVSIPPSTSGASESVRPIGLDNETESVELTPAALRALEQGVAKRQKVIRVFEDGNPWLIVREDNVRCKLTARVERSSGLMQVIMTLGLVSGPPQLLPAEVRASCQGNPLRCLTVAEALETLYGAQKEREKPDEHAAACDHYSFREVSQMDEYQIPTNYKRLHEETKRTTGLPALAVVPGTFYPGTPLLGDARALSSFALQRQLCQCDEPDKLGWIVFFGEPLKHGGTVQIQLDLGHGPVPLTFLVPKP
jgi:hypothetical protein